ncbi:hypothetical protein PFISCL1PPCAC_4326, partial [Pristionchus fissidentatus]
MFRFLLLLVLIFTVVNFSESSPASLVKRDLSAPMFQLNEKTTDGYRNLVRRIERAANVRRIE